MVRYRKIDSSGVTQDVTARGYALIYRGYRFMVRKEFYSKKVGCKFRVYYCKNFTGKKGDESSCRCSIRETLDRSSHFISTNRHNHQKHVQESPPRRIPQVGHVRRVHPIHFGNSSMKVRTPPILDHEQNSVPEIPLTQPNRVTTSGMNMRNLPEPMIPVTSNHQERRLFNHHPPHKEEQEQEDRTGAKRPSPGPNTNQADSEIRGVYPREGGCEGGQVVSIFFTVDRNVYLNRYHGSIPFVHRVMFGSGVATHKNNFSRPGDDIQLVFFQRNDQQAYMDYRDADFRLEVLTPPSDRPGPVDITVDLQGESIGQIVTIHRRSCYTYLDDEDVGVSNPDNLEDLPLPPDDFGWEDQSLSLDLGKDGGPPMYSSDGMAGDLGGSYNFFQMDEFGANFLFYLAARGELDRIKYHVEEKNFDVTHRDMLGYTALDVANHFNRKDDVCDYLRSQVRLLPETFEDVSDFSDIPIDDVIIEEEEKEDKTPDWTFRCKFCEDNIGKTEFDPGRKTLKHVCCVGSSRKILYNKKQENEIKDLTFRHAKCKRRISNDVLTKEIECKECKETIFGGNVFLDANCILIK